MNDVAPAASDVAAGGTYTVRRGDYLYGIARATGTDLDTLLALNGLTLRSLILPGQVLKLGGAASPNSQATPEWSGATYTVRRGDYLYGIARTTGTELGTLLALNGLTPRSLILPGQVLKISGAAPSASDTYTVASGDCWSCIARRLGVTLRELLAANGATTSTVIHPGQRIAVPAGAAPVTDSPVTASPPLVAAPRPNASDPQLVAELDEAVGAWRVQLAATLGGRPVRIVWDSSILAGADAVAERTLTIRVHPRMQERSTRVLHDILAHEFGHIVVLIAVERGALADPGICHEKVADEIASRLRAKTVLLHRTASCTWDAARAIADDVMAQGF